VAIGYQAGKALTTGGGNTALGESAMVDLVEGTNNTAIGKGAFGGALDATADASTGNVFIGKDAGGGAWVTAVSNYNVAVGNLTMDAAMDGALNNTAVGYSALSALTTGADNVASGFQSLYANTEGVRNVASGMYALYNNTTGDRNTASGTYALYINTEGDKNIASGYAALYAVSTGDNNIGIGVDSGRTGSPGGNITTADNQLCLGDENITDAHVQVDWTVASDQRDKTDFTALDLGLDFVNDLEPVTYKWDKRSKYGDKTAEDYDLAAQTPDGTHKEDWLDIGFKAQEVEALEIAAGYDKDNKTNLTTTLSGDGKQYGLQYTKFVPILVKAIQELSAEVESLKEQLNS
jgi:hypothetical protein